jgi:sugar lactone lactonase YvrE
MPSEESSTPEVQTLLTGVAFGESPRWHGDRLWFSDWGAQEVVAVDLEGNSQVIVQVRFPSFASVSSSPDLPTNARIL